MTPDQLAKEVGDFVQQKHPVLFAGAGVGVRLGLPNWSKYLDHLADICEQKNDKISADLIKQRRDDGDYLGAAAIYKSNKRIPIGERLRHLAEPFDLKFKKETLALLKPLMCLHWSGIVTTNYDRGLHQAYAFAQSTAAVQLELDDSLKAGSTRTDFFIARIHGKCESPQTIMLDERDYDLLRANKIYVDFLIQLFRSRPLIFVGYSFDDPAIDFICSLTKEILSPNYPIEHLAIIPASSEKRLSAKLSDVNIKVLSYDDSADHDDLWRCFRACYEQPEQTPLDIELAAAVPDELSSSPVHRYLAFSYARMTAPNHAKQPVLETAVDGLVLALVSQLPGTNVDKAQLIGGVAEALGIKADEAEQISEDALTRLVSAGDLTATRSFVSRRAPDKTEFARQLAVLAKGVRQRVNVIGGKEVPASDESKITDCFERLFLARAWDLALQYGGGLATHAADLERTVFAIADQVLTKAKAQGSKIAEAICHLVRRPNPFEAQILSDMARTAFALQLVVGSPRQSLQRKHLLPDLVYFDASVLMPAIALGHPFQVGYSDAIKRLREASRQSAHQCELVFAEQFLEEITTHRTKSKDLVREGGLEKRERMLRHVALYGAENTNVFVGAFSSRFLDSDTERLSFDDFLAEVAPYETIDELRAFLQKQDFVVRGMTFQGAKAHVFTAVFNPLLTAYESVDKGELRQKDRILIQHEAQQLCQLMEDGGKGLRSVFVTADTRLQRVVAASGSLCKLSELILSQIGFLGIIDIIAGLRADSASFARLIWGYPRNDAQKQLRDYLVRVGLEKYDEGIAMEMPKVISSVLSAVNSDIERRSAQITSATDVATISDSNRFLDTLETRYFEEMDRVISKRREQEQ